MIYNKNIKGCEFFIALLPEFQSKGYGPEITNGFLKVWHEQTDQSLFATAMSENEKAIKVLGSLGFRKVKEYDDFLGKTIYVYKIFNNIR